MKKTKNNGVFVNLALHIIGFSLCILPPTICALTYFPLWKSVGYDSCIAGGAALVLILCFFPLMKFFARAISSYSSYFLWFLCFALFFALSKIADQMTVISFVGFVGNLLGAMCFRIAKRYAKKEVVNE